jgi:Holliday junction resolvase
MKAERKLELELIKALNQAGWFAHHFDIIGTDGWPDILALKRNTYALIECKAGTKLRKEQIAFHIYLKENFEISIFLIEQIGEQYVVTLDNKVKHFQAGNIKSVIGYIDACT